MDDQRTLVTWTTHQTLTPLAPGSISSSPQEEDAVKYAFDNVWRVLQRLQGRDVGGRDGVERRKGGLQRGLRFLQLLFRVVLDRRDLRGLPYR